MEHRIESDLAEVSDGASYLMICAGRKMVFLAGAVTAKVPLADVTSIDSDGTSLVVHGTVGETHACPLPSAAPADVAPLAARLNDCVSAWR